MTVHLVGAGPGDPGLVTVRGAEVLRLADVVVYDRLAHPALVDLAPAGAERVYVGKGPGHAELSQDQINEVLVERGRAGLEVVRLKGGDPFVFGRGGEEAEALRDAGVAFEVVPGVTSAIAAPAYGGIPVTHRGLASHVTIVTGHEDPEKGGQAVDWEAISATLAGGTGTLVVLMGAGHLPEIARRLSAGGMSPDTPVAAVRWGTRPEQRTVRGTLATVGELGVEAPSAIVVGAVAALDFGWFETRPLFGRRVVVTRAREQASELRHRLEDLGAEVLEMPTITIEGIEFEPPDLSRFSWLVFTSANGVRALFDRWLTPAGLDARHLAGVRVACIGPGTAAALAARGVRADLVPPRFVAEALVDVFPAAGSDVRAEMTADRGPIRVLLARAEGGRDVLPEGLALLGYEVEVLPVYRAVATDADVALVGRVRAGEVDAVTFTSSSTVSNYCRTVGGLVGDGGRRPLVLCIGPVTAQTARERGLPVDAVASEHTIDGLVAEVVRILGS